MTSMPHASPVMSTALHPGARPGHARTLDLADLLGAQTPRPELAADLTILEAFLPYHDLARRRVGHVGAGRIYGAVVGRAAPVIGTAPPLRRVLGARPICRGPRQPRAPHVSVTGQGQPLHIPLLKPAMLGARCACGGPFAWRAAGAPPAMAGASTRRRTSRPARAAVKTRAGKSARRRAAAEPSRAAVWQRRAGPAAHHGRQGGGANRPPAAAPSIPRGAAAACRSRRRGAPA